MRFDCSERVGKAIRQPSKNTLLSFASTQLGAEKLLPFRNFWTSSAHF
jgi:hypothetical protein